MSIKKVKKISIKTFFAMFFYLIIPIISIIIVLSTYDELSKERFINMFFVIIPIAIFIILISQISKKYEKASFKKYIFNILYVLLTLLWVYGFIGGNPVITEKWLEYEFSIHLWKYISLIIIAAIINIIYYTLEWRFYRKELRTKNEEKLFYKKFPEKNYY